MSLRSRGRGPIATLIALASLFTLVLAVPAAMAAPSIDGNLADLITYINQIKADGTGVGAVIVDKQDINGNPTPETILSDASFIPCQLPAPLAGQHFINGYEIFYAYLAYVPGTTQLYLGLRSEGFIGDVDGNGNPNTTGGGTCNVQDNIKEPGPGDIAGSEQYLFTFDLDCNGSVDASLRLQDNSLTGFGLFAGTTNSFEYRENAGVGASGRDLEILVNLSAPLPSAFSFKAVEAGNNVDGLSEDKVNGIIFAGTPKISVTKEAVPSSICAGKPTRFTIVIRNDGQTALSVTATDVLPAALSYAGNFSSACAQAPSVNGQTLTFTAFDLAVGASCSISFDALSSADCFGQVTNTVDVVGVFNSACVDPAGLATTASASAIVTCKANPCVELTQQGPASACPGEKVTIKGTVKNCSTDVETIVVTVNGAQFFNQSVNAGATVNWSGTASMPSDCTAGANSSFAVVATSTNECNTDSKNGVVLVRCNDKVCVNVNATRNPESACPGTPITIRGTADNCSIDSETIVVTVNGVQVASGEVAGGGSLPFTTTIPMPQCTDGEAVPFVVVATATGQCPPQASETMNLSVICRFPQVQIDKSVTPAGPVEQGTTLHYSITVTNPSKTVALENVVVRDPLCSEVTFQGNAVPAPDAGGPTVGGTGTLVWSLGTIAPGGSQTITFDALVNTLASPACEAQNRSCTNTATVEGNCADAIARAEDSVTTPIIACVTPGLCRLTGGGCMNDNPDTGNRGHKQSTFGGNASPLINGKGVTGNEWQHVYRDGRTILFNWHSHDAHVIQCSVVGVGPCSPNATNTKADFVGTGMYSIGSGGRDQEGNMVAYIIDHREGSCNKGTRDEYSIIVRTGLVIGEGTIVFQATGSIDCGNLQIHETPARIFGSGIALPGNEAATTGVALLNRAYPNPFSGSTTFAYKVANGGASVEVGVYNVAGRMVKSLAAGSQPAGTYSVKWDGSDDSGVRMAPGVYFLKSKVGGDLTVNRLIYVSR
ncbi:MAG: FlgD immunoglobulin-like domain containing protein [Candidatus Binatia bacterium]